MKLRDFEKSLIVSFGADASGICVENGSRGGLQQQYYNAVGLSDSSYYSMLEEYLKNVITSCEDNTITISVNTEDPSDLFFAGVWTLKLFVQCNFTGSAVHLNNSTTEFLTKLDVLRPNLILDGEALLDNIEFIGLISIAEEIFKNIEESTFPSVSWWRMRTDFLHEQMLEEKSAVLWGRIQSYDENLRKILVSDQDDSSLEALYCLELARMHLFHYDVTKAKDLMSYAATSFGVDVTLVGALGKRTRYQQTELAQLIVRINLTEESSRHDSVFDTTTSVLPKDIPLNDDTRLEKVQLSEDVQCKSLTPLQQIILLNFFFVRKSFLGNDDVTTYESQAFLDTLLSDPKIWSVQLVSLLNRSLLEKGRTRTVSRALQQLEQLKGDITANQPPYVERLHFFFCSHMPLKFKVDVALAEVYASIGSINSALDIYLRLGMWEPTIECYNALQLRHKAEEIIRAELQKGETVKLWCLLGDANDNPECYEKAWELSGHKSSRAQRQWGYYYYLRKQYEKATTHLEIAVALNPLEYPVWMRLAFSAMQVENWDLCAKAYRHACVLDSDNFESWNNLGNCYLKMNDKSRALKVFLEATKCDYNIWQVWDNIIAVACDCRNFDEVVRGYNRLLDLKGKHIDAEVLEILVAFICQNKDDYNGTGSLKYLKPALKLFGRITASVTTNGTLWKLYSDLLATEEEVADEKNRVDVLHRSVDCAQKAVRCLLQDQKWDKFIDNIKEVVNYGLNLGQRTTEFVKKYPDSSSTSTFKATALFTINRLIASLKKKKLESIDANELYDGFICDLEKMSAILNAT